LIFPIPRGARQTLAKRVEAPFATNSLQERSSSKRPLRMWADEEDSEEVALFDNPLSLKSFEPTGALNQVLRCRLWIGDYLDSGPGRVQEFGIEAIVSLGEPSREQGLSYGSASYDGRLVYPTIPSVTYHRIWLHDDPNEQIDVHFESATDFIHTQLQQGKKVLVHCQAGVSRSATIVIAYLMRYMHLSYSQAFQVVLQCRHFINPNAGFKTQLLAYEKKLQLNL
jgi:hypothetical protein